MAIPAGLCQCGCGELAPLAVKTNRAKGYIKGQPHRFINGHQHNGAMNGRWRGGRRMDGDGYVAIAVGGGRSRPEHVLVAERVLGKELPEGAPVHHVNEDRKDNRPANLVICQDNSYHMLLHRRLRALRASGDPNWRKCPYCKQYDNPAKMYVPNAPQRQAVHRSCAAAARRLSRAEGGQCA